MKVIVDLCLVPIGVGVAEVLEFWFGDIQPRQWFAKDPAGARRGVRRLERGWLEAEVEQARAASSVAVTRDDARRFHLNS